MVSPTLVDQVEKQRKKFLAKYYLFHLLFAITFVAIVGICFLPYGIEIYNKLLLGFYEEVMQYILPWCILALVFIGIYYILLLSIRKVFDDSFTQYIKKEVVSNTYEYHGMFKVDNYFSSTNWFYTVYRDIFPEANRINTRNCFLIDYKGKKIKVGEVKIGQKIGIGEYSKYYSLFSGYFIQVPAEIAESHSLYRNILYQDHYVFVVDKNLIDADSIGMNFSIFEKVDNKDLERFCNAMLTILGIVSNTVRL